MENMDDLGGNGVMKMPPGFRFHPTDEELILHYLKKKVFSRPLPSPVIPEIELCEHDPWDLPGPDSDEEKYFFSVRGVKCRSGFWKAVGSEKQIVECRSNQVVGMKKVFAFCVGKPSNASKTSWVMHEYSLLDAGSKAAPMFPGNKNSSQNSVVQMGDWVLCRIFSKKTSAGNGEMRENSNKSNMKKRDLITFLGSKACVDEENSSC